MSIDRVPILVAKLWDIVRELEKIFPGLHFTPDGHLVGSLGEALASHYYGITLYPASHKKHDGQKEGIQVQVKATQGNRVAIRSEPEHLLILKLHKDGTFDEVYNGPGKPVWAQVVHKPRPSNGQYQIGLAKLLKLDEQVADGQRLQRIC